MSSQLVTRIGCSVPLAACLLIALTRTAAAGLVSEESWREVSHDERYVLVMVSPYPAAKESSWLAPWASRQSEVHEIRAKYTKSGLYRNDGSTEPLWMIPYHLPVYESYVSPNGEQVIIVQEDWGHTISNIPSGGAVFFFDKGGKIVGYQDHELTWCWLLKGLTNNLMGRNFAECDDASFDAGELTYTIKTNQSEEFVFDVTTGKVIRHWSLWPFYLGTPLVGVPVVLLGYYRTRRRRGNVKHRQRPAWGQFSLRGMLAFVTALCVVLWGISINGVFVIICLTIALLGGAVAWAISKTRQAWLIGGILSLYGGAIGLVGWARLCDFFVWSLPYFKTGIGTLVTLEFIGAMAGGLVAGWIERTQRVTKCKPMNAAALSTDRIP